MKELPNVPVINPDICAMPDDGLAIDASAVAAPLTLLDLP